MRIVRLSPKSFSKILSLAERILRSGGTVVAPTDTVYGILGDATNKDVVKKIFAIKERSTTKALPIFVKNIATTRKYAYVSDAKATFLEKIWPGPITFIFYHKEKLPSAVTGGFDTIGIRIPANEFLLELLGRLDFPLVQTSANISGQMPARNTKEIKACFVQAGFRPDLVIDGGGVYRFSSSVFDFTGNEPKVIRLGAMSKDTFDRLFKTMI